MLLWVAALPLWAIRGQLATSPYFISVFSVVSSSVTEYLQTK
jgi:hypothetical protein